MIHNYLQRVGRIRAALFAAILLAFAACNTAPEQPATVAGHTKLEDLEGHSVAVVASSTCDVLLSDTNNFTNITLVRCATPYQTIQMVKSGQADCGIADTISLMNLPMQANGLAIDFTLPGGFDVAAAFNPENEKLCKQFNDFLVQIKSDGTLDQMFARWCSPHADTVAMPAMPELAGLKGHPIEVATLVENTPFSFYRDNNWVGLEAEMMLRFSLFVGRPIHFSGYHLDEIISILRSQKADIAAASLFITPDRAEQVLFSHPYYFCKTCCFSQARP